LPRQSREPAARERRTDGALGQIDRLPQLNAPGAAAAKGLNGGGSHPKTGGGEGAPNSEKGEKRAKLRHGRNSYKIREELVGNRLREAI